MLAEITVLQLYEWMEYAGQKPFGEERADLRAGIIAATMANAWRGKSGRRFQPSDFMPKFKRRPKRQSPEHMKQMLRTYSAAHNAYIRQRRKHG